MKYLFILLTILLTSPLFAQVDFRKKYYPAINRAEMAITKDDYQTAFLEYQSAFSAVETPLARDIFNSVACKFLLNDFEGAKPLLLKLAKKGISAEVLERKEVFQISSIRDRWMAFKPVYESLISEFDAEIFEISANELFNLKDSIQKYTALSYFKADLGNGKNFYKFEELLKSKGGSDSVYLKSLKPIDSILVEKEIKENSEISNKLLKTGKDILFDLIDKYPDLEESSFKITGEQLADNFVLSELNFFLGYRFSYDNHFGGIRRYSEDSLVNQENNFLLEKSLEAVKNGKINPMNAFKLLNWPKEKASFLYNFIHVFVIRVEDTSGCSKLLSTKGFITYAKKGQLTDIELNMFEKWKVEYGLDDLDNLIQKEIYAMTKNRYFTLKNNKEIEASTVPNCSVAEQTLLNATIIQD
jgi:hypothetical protein